MPTNVCNDFARILKGAITSSDTNFCVVTRMRSINATIMGRPTISPLALAAMFSYEAIDKDGNALNLGETVILQREINDFIDVLRENDITVTALHNHWLFERPRLMYIHFEAIDAPLNFAENVSKAFDTFSSRVDDSEE